MWFYNIFCLLVSCLMLTACGFQPLYAPCEKKGAPSYPLKIATIPERQGQILRNYLVDLLIPEGAPETPRYILEVTLQDTIKNIGVNKDETTSRKEAILTANILLKDCKKKTIVYTHTAKAINSFSVISENYYSDLVAEEYGKKQAIRLLAEKIELLLRAYFNQVHCASSLE